MKIFIVLSESPLKAWKSIVYSFLISFPVPELLMFKDLWNNLKNGTQNARSWIKSMKIDKICEVMAAVTLAFFPVVWYPLQFF